MAKHRNYKIIACDLDGTLLGPDRRVSSRNRAAIQKAHEQGVKFVPATGRGVPSIQGTLQEIGLYDMTGEYVLSCNGGAITENRGNRLLRFDGLAFAQASLLFHRGLEYNVGIHVYTQETVYAYNLAPEVLAHLRTLMEINVLQEPCIDFLRETPIAKVLFQNPNQAYLRQIETELGGIAEDLEVCYSTVRCIEFNPKGINKGVGLLRLAELLDVDPADTIAIGDNLNDRPMILAAGLGVGVQNAVEGIKADCDYITSADHGHHAVAEVIEKFVL